MTAEIAGKRIEIALAMFIMLSLVCGGVLHSILPHHHPHVAIADTQHSALRHEEKKLLLLVFVSIASVSVALFLVVGGGVINPAYALEPPDTSIRRVLRRGVVAYRKFR